MARAAGAQRGHHGERALVLGDQRVDLRLADVGDAPDQIADAVAVDRPAELDLRLDAVAAGHGDLAHVHAAEARDLHAPRVGERARGARPAVELGEHVLVLPVADDDLARQAQARADEPELPVAVRRLVQVHEVHVDLAPGQIAIELRVQVGQRLLAGASARRSTSSTARRCASR